MKLFTKTLLALAIATPLAANAIAPQPTNELKFTTAWTTTQTGAEINAYDKASNRVFVTNATDNTLDVLDGSTGKMLEQIKLTGGPNSVAVSNGVVAVAVENPYSKQLSGSVQFYNAASSKLLKTVPTGSLPDMLTFTPDGKKVIVAVEGEPNKSYTNDPVGQVDIIDISKGLDKAKLSIAGFGGFNKADLKAQGVQIFGPNASAAQDLEPEYVAVNKAGTKAMVTLQENNAVAIVDIATSKIESIKSLGEKDYSKPGNEMDLSDKDGIVGNLKSAPVKSLYQPDAIASFNKDGKDYYVTANEGDSRDYKGIKDEVRLGKAKVDPKLAAELELKYGPDWAEKKNLGRLKITMAASDTDGDGDIDRVVGYGGRSFSILDDQGNMIFDSANLLTRITLAAGTYPDDRSDAKGTEPEGLTVGKINGKNYLFLLLERSSDIVVFNIDDVKNPLYVSIIKGIGKSPEGITFVDNDGKPFILASYEYKNILTARIDITEVPVPAAAWLFGSALLGLAKVRRKK